MPGIYVPTPAERQLVLGTLARNNPSGRCADDCGDCGSCDCSCRCADDCGDCGSCDCSCRCDD
ncbi:hypothetical protein COS54_02005 [Candidatus Shapirobacteria bacterium CG03_land_8_20_14_0_80_39_12]|uniref:Metallothionein n=1 Tax=Candidatus Shapirobacteria bacterium CG03_land_8_20_14_0_80_39_12 TaxID=1974879 RepID=A0A2M7BCT3_9BACT|nr:MAG: hypothetical protein COS54_02005 [Candidatus Shapirobacteria bacterium CG03_land_8_20_14_0_80_39_12]